MGKAEILARSIIKNGPKFAGIEGYQTGSPASFCFWRSSASRLIICCRSGFAGIEDDCLISYAITSSATSRLLAADNIQFLKSLDAASEWTAQKALLRGPLHAPSISPNGHDEVRN